MYRNSNIKWVTAAFLGTFHLLALAAFAFPFQWAYLPVMIGLYLWMGFSTTFYLHRCLTHRAFEAAGWVKFVSFLGVAVGQQGDPVGWVGHHRWHHAKSDKDEDVHSPIHGFLYSHFGWILRSEGATDHKLRALAKDIREKYWYARLGENAALFMIPHLAVAAALYFTMGLGGMLWCLYLPMVAVYHVTWSVNSLCHLPQFGYRTTETSDRSRNFWLIGLLALGEGWHNNHHACQTRAPQGQTWKEIDLTTYLIWTLEKMRLVWNVKWHAPVRSVTEPVLAPEGLPQATT
ncbi:MAG: acyl-CoA desaturase [Candidatus Sericytochromatia bacterium]